MNDASEFYQANRDVVISGMWQYAGVVQVSRPRNESAFLRPEKEPPPLNPLPFTFRLAGTMNAQTGAIDGVLYADGKIVECFGATGWVPELSS